MQILLPALKKLRTAAGLSQQTLAERTGLSVSTISKHEQGSINGIDGETLDALCDALSCLRHDLFLPGNSEISEFNSSPTQEVTPTQTPSAPAPAPAQEVQPA